MGLPEKSSAPWASWQSCDDGRAAVALERLADALPAFFADSILLSSRSSELSFYTDVCLIELGFVRDHGTERAFVLDGPVGTLWLDGESDTIHTTNENESLALTDSTVADYVRFFFYFLRADEGAFVLIENSAEIGPGEAGEHEAAVEGESLSLEAARSHAHQLTMTGKDEEGRWLFDATVAYGGACFTCSIAVRPDGVVEMIDDDPIGELGSLVAAQPPSLQLQIQVDHLAKETAAHGVPHLDRQSPVDVPRDREITEAVV
jgi:hypothetical protein